MEQKGAATAEQALVDDGSLDDVLVDAAHELRQAEMHALARGVERARALLSFGAPLREPLDFAIAVPRVRDNEEEEEVRDA